MKQTARSLLTVLIAVFLCVAVPRPASAEETAATLDLPVSVQFHGNTAGSSNHTAVFTIASLDGAPMPQGASGNPYRFEIQGNVKTTLHFSFSESGTWKYELTASCETGTITPGKLTLTIRVEGNTVFVVAETVDGKKTDLTFQVELPSGFTPPTPPTGDDSQLALHIAAAGISLLLIVLLTVALIRLIRRKEQL